MTRLFIERFTLVPIRTKTGVGVGVGVEVGDVLLIVALSRLLHLVGKEKGRGKGEGSDSSRGLVN